MSSLESEWEDEIDVLKGEVIDKLEELLAKMESTLRAMPSGVHDAMVATRAAVDKLEAAERALDRVRREKIRELLDAPCVILTRGDDS